MNAMRNALFLSLTCVPAFAQVIQTPEQFFGFKIGTDGELAKYPKVLDYMRHLRVNSNRVQYEELGKTAMGNPYVMVRFSSPENLSRLDRLVEINRRLANPRGLSEEEAAELAGEGRVFLFLYATIHSTEVGNGQAIIEIAHQLATSDSPRIREILDNTVVLLVPSQNPDGQILAIDHYYKYRGTEYSDRYPDLYHKYTGHDDNRDWFMFTQVETRLNIEKVQNFYRPHITHDMHQMGSANARIFVPPFKDPYDRNFHPILAQAQLQIGQAMASALIAEGKGGVTFNTQYDLWTPARQYMVYHGQPRILTEIASVNLANPQISPDGAPLGPQEKTWNFPLPYDKAEWRLRDIVDYGYTAVFGELTHLAKYRSIWLENFYKVHRDWVNRTEAPYAFVVPADQPDPFETYELLQTLEFGDVEIHQATAPFSAGGQEYAAGSWVVLLAQPYGAFAKTMLETQDYPDLRYFAGGPPIPPYDVTAHTLGYLLGVQVDQIEAPFEADLALLETVVPPATSPVAEADLYLVGPESNAGFIAVARLQQANQPVLRSAEAFRVGERSFAPGTWIVPAGDRAGQILGEVAEETGLVVTGTNAAPQVRGFRLAQPTRIGLMRGANNMPGGWMMWQFEQYGFNHEIVSAHDFAGDLSDKYDVIVWPSGTNRNRIVRGLDSQQHDSEWSWAFGVGEDGWQKLRQWVVDGGTIVALGDATETARQMFDLPIEGVIPSGGGGGRRGGGGRGGQAVSAGGQGLRETFQSPANLLRALRDQVVPSNSLFYCPGSLLRNQFDTSHPIAYGMPDEWPVFFRNAQAYRLKPGFGSTAEVVSRYPAQGPILESGWLLGEEYLRDQANAISFEIGQGSVVTIASQAAFRTQSRATFKLLYNAMFQGPAEAIDAEEMARAASSGR